MPLYFRDYLDKQIRLSDEREQHITSTHPEMVDQQNRISETLSQPDQVVRSQADQQVKLYYKLYQSTPVTTKYLCIVIKSLEGDPFIITTYFTDSMKKGEQIWTKK